jgi:predicted glycosyltransferase
LNSLLKLAPHVIARSGYTTIMDLHRIGRRAILFPTKGQWEQEYLAKWWRNGQ